MDRMSGSTRARLSAMMFLQYAVHAVWIMQLGAYLEGSLSFTGSQVALVANTVALGCLLAPIFVGMFADRFFPSEKILAILNIAGGALLFWAATIQNLWLLFGVLLVQQLCYMPTWAITNSIAIANCTDTEKDLPRIRVFGSIGWVATMLFGIVSVKMLNIPWDGTGKPMMAGAVMSVIAGLFAFALPHTPPPAAGKKSSLADVFGLKALALMKSPSFAIFIIVSLVVMIPFMAYWTFLSMYLGSMGVVLITGTSHLGQVVEVLVMAFLLSIALKKIGVKWTLVAGVAALTARYVCFMFGNGEELMFLNYTGILVHGVIFSFFFVTGYVYADKVAPKEIRSQAQALIVLVTFGAGALLGNWINGKIVDANAIPGELVAAGYKVPLAIPAAPSLAIEGAKVSDTLVYNRAISGDEVVLLNAMQLKKDQLVERLKKEFGDKADLDKGKVTIPLPSQKLSFSTWLELPEVKEPLTGAIFKIGDGKEALSLGLDQGRLTLQAGEAKLAQPSALPGGTKTHVVATFDGKLLKLYTDRKLYRRFDWKKVWTYPAIISGVLLVLMLLFFHVKPTATEEELPEQAPAGEPPAEAAPQAPEAPGEPAGYE